MTEKKKRTLRSAGWFARVDKDGFIHRSWMRGYPQDVFDGMRAASLANRSQLYLDIASGPFFGYNRPGAKPSKGIIDSFWMQGMMGGHKNTYDCIKAFSETDFTADLRSITVPTLVMHGDDDQIVPIATSALLSVKLLKNGTLKVYKGFPHGMCTTQADTVNPDLLAFIAQASVHAKATAA